MNDLIKQLLRAQTYSFRGRLVADPEIKYLPSGAMVANARIAIDHPEKKGRDDGKDPDWMKLEVWFEAAEAFANAAKKGQLIDCAGRIRFESWNDRNTGEQRHQPVLKMHSWSAVDTAKPAAPAAAAAAPVAADWLSSDQASDEEIPF